jgi:hypothetical protein
MRTKITKRPFYHYSHGCIHCQHVRFLCLHGGFYLVSFYSNWFKYPKYRLYSKNESNIYSWIRISMYSHELFSQVPKYIFSLFFVFVDLVFFQAFFSFLFLWFLFFYCFQDVSVVYVIGFFGFLLFAFSFFRAYVLSYLWFDFLGVCSFIFLLVFLHVFICFLFVFVLHALDFCFVFCVMF